MRSIQEGDIVRVNDTAPREFRGWEGMIRDAFSGNRGGYDFTLSGVAFHGSELDLIDPAETQQTQLPPVSVASLALPLDEPVNVPADPDVEPQPYDMPSPEADALDRIEDVIQAEEYSKEQWDAIFPVFQILRATGRL